MVSKKRLNEIAKQKGIKGYSRMKKDELLELLENLPEEPYKIQASRYWKEEEKKKKKTDTFIKKIKKPMDILKQKVDVLRKATEKVVPEKVSETVVKSVETGIDYLKNIWEKRKLLKDKARETVRKRLLDLNKKFSKWFEKPEFEIREINFLAGKKYIIKGKEGYFPVDFLRKNEKNIEDIFLKNTETKARLILSCEMISSDIKTGEELKNDAKFYSNFQEIYEGNDISQIISEMIGRVLENMDNFTRGKSNWRFQKIIDLEIQIEEMIHDDGIGKFIPTPEPIANKNATINMKNEKDEECLKWCVIRALFPTKHHPERITNQLREQAKTLNWKGVTFPVEMRDVGIFEKIIMFQLIFSDGIMINMKFIEKQKSSKKKHINLLLFMVDGKKHFCLISSMTRLLRKGNQRNQRFYCDNCLNSRRTKESLEKHKEYCESFEACKTVYPKENFMYFKNYKNQTSIPFRIYADSEAILKPINDQGHGEFQEHQPSGCCFYTVAESGEKFSPILTRGENCVDEFLDK